MPKPSRPSRTATGAAAATAPALAPNDQPDAVTAIPVSPLLYQPVSTTPAIGQEPPVMRAAAPGSGREPMVQAAAAPALAGEPMVGAEAISTTPEAQAQKSGYVSILSQRLPEPTSYSGKNVIAFDFQNTLFKERPNEGQLLDFDGQTTYVEFGNPPHLQGGTSSSLTIEAWVKADSRGGSWQHIVSHGQEE